MNSIIIFGAGGLARELLELLRDMNRVEPRWEILGFVDDDVSLHGTTRNDLPVLGGCQWLVESGEKPFAVLGVGSPVAKRRISRALRDHVSGFPTLVHPTVVDSRYVEYGEGVVVTAGTVLTANIEVGDFATLNLLTTVGHDCRIGSFVTLSPSVNLSGRVTIGDGCDIGTGAKVVPGLSIGEWSTVGAGAVVARDLPANCTAVGVPAKVIKERESGWHLQ